MIALSFDSFAAAQPPGALVIVGGGSLPKEVTQKFFDLAGGKNAKIVVIPTASIDADAPKKRGAFLKQWKELGSTSVELLHTRDRKQADDQVFVGPLREASAVWLSGGDQNGLIAAYRGTLVEKELHKLLERGGVIGGTSAGAAAMSAIMIQGGRDADVRTGSGFGFVKGIVLDQHFTNRNRAGRLRKVLNEHPNDAGLGVDESTALVVRGDFITVLGAGTVTAIWPKQSSQPKRERVFKPGETFDRRDLAPSIPAKRAG